MDEFGSDWWWLIWAVVFAMAVYLLVGKYM